MKLKNRTDEERNVTFRLSGIVSYYTGVTSERIFSQSFTDKLQPNEGTLNNNHDAFKGRACLGSRP